MIYKRFYSFLLIRVLILFCLVSICGFSLQYDYLHLTIGTALLALVYLFNLHRYIVRRFREIDDFFEAVKYRDFSRRFVEDLGPRDIRNLHKGFNEVNRVVREINAKKELQYLYLQKILELVEVGIIAYDIESEAVLWANDSFRNILDFPSFKKISFVARRRPVIYAEIFQNHHPKPEALNLEIKGEPTKLLISDTVFRIEDNTYKLVVLQNIDETLNQNEAEAWKKLLSVMTHEIMNSIAPISSLADTLHDQVLKAIEDPETDPVDMEDMELGIASIKNRSEGLMKFARTYRSLNKVTQLNLSRTRIADLFRGIESLMWPTLKEKRVHLEFQGDLNLEIEVDNYLIEQVLINLVLNAIEATEGIPTPRIQMAVQTKDSNTIIKITDNGTGIPEEIRETIFVPFFTTKSSGSGIGLSLSKQIMLLHKGRINIHSKQGQGTAVHLIFEGK